MARHHISGGAVLTTVSGSLAASGGLAITIADATGWPDASVGAYGIVVSEGTAREEKMWVTLRAGSTLTVTAGNRGADGTTAKAHNSGDAIRPAIFATYIDEADAHVYDTTLHLGVGTISNANMFAAGVVDAAAIAANAVGSSEIAADSVGSSELANACIDGTALFATHFAPWLYDTHANIVAQTPAVGTPGYCTDTGELLVYYGATTLWKPPWALPWGQVAFVEDGTVNQTGITAVTDLTGITATWTAVANRRYRCSLYVPDVAGAVVTIDSTLSIRQGSAVLRKHQKQIGSAVHETQEVNFVTTFAAGSVTLKGSISAVSGGGGSVSVVCGDAVTEKICLSIEDVGPIPAQAPPSP